jgi:hypothetical protein
MNFASKSEAIREPSRALSEVEKTVNDERPKSDWSEAFIDDSYEEDESGPMLVSESTLKRTRAYGEAHAHKHTKRQMHSHSHTVTHSHNHTHIHTYTHTQHTHRNPCRSAMTKIFTAVPCLAPA